MATVTGISRLSKRERTRMLQVFDEMLPRIPARSKAAVKKELHEIRRLRQAGGRRSLRVPN